MTSKKDKHPVLSVLSISILAIILALLMSLSNTLQTLELKFLDMRFKLRGPIQIDDNPIVIIKIDDQSDESLKDRWPWRRSYYAHIIKNLNEAGAAVIGIDVNFDQPDRNGARYDDELAQAIEKYKNVVLTGKLLRTSGQYSYNTIYPPYDKFLTPHSRWGLVGIEPDLDGFYRRYRVAETYRDSLYGSFDAEILHLYEKDSSKTWLKSDEENFYVGDHIIPKFDENSMLINYVGPAFSFPSYSFDNIVDDEEFPLRDEYDLNSFDDPGDPELGIPPGPKYNGSLKGKIVLIGSTMLELHDNFPTPFLIQTGTDNQDNRVETPGVEIHANALMTILRQDYLRNVPFYITLLTVLIGTLLAFLITHFFRTFWSVVLTAIAILAFVALSVYAFVHFNLILQIVFPLLANAFAYVGHTLYHYLQTQQEKKVLRGAFAYYVPEKVVQEIINNPDKLVLGGEERIISVIFSDVAGFTSISEKLSPRELVSLLNEYLTAMTDIVLQNNGIIDKYEGDAIMAEFGMPVPFEDHPQAACRTALQMQEKLKEMREKWKDEGKPELSARVGINTGEVIVGNMGSQTVFDYTVMGDHVNLGSRLEGANKFYDTKVMISEFTYEYVKNDFFTRPLDLIRVKGKQKPIEVFELIASRDESLPSGYIEMLTAYQKGIQSYRNREWKPAIEYFDFCLNQFPDDYPSKIYRKRCAEFKINDPGPDWDGVTTMTEK